MDKLLTYPGKTDKGIFTFVIDAERSYLEKTAAEYHPTIAAYIHNAKPIKNKLQLLITALGAGEWWSCNVNGDYFPESELAYAGPEYGHKTFETTAKIYKHHINKDPARSYGDVVLSVYNPTYRRVELIVAVDLTKGMGIEKAIDNGEYPDWSMGCLPKYAKVLMKDGSEKAISDLKPGDEIISGMGGVSKVDYPHSHPHKGTWYHVKTLGMLRDPEKVTEEHPWYVIPKEQVECNGNPNNKSRKINLCLPNSYEKKECTGCPHAHDLFNPKWIRSDELKVGDYIATPIISSEGKEVKNNYAFLAGHYVANGYGIKNWKCIVIPVNNEALFLEDEFKRLFPSAKIYSRPRANSENASDIFIVHAELYERLTQDFGRTLEDKSIFEVFKWEQVAQKYFLGSLIDGDGGRYKDSLYISTSKEQIAFYLQMLLAGVGCISSVNTILHKPSTIVDKDTVEYQIWIGQDSAYTICEYSRKGSGIEKPKMFKNSRFIANGFLWSPILSIDTEDCDEEVYNVAVKSFSHDTDSYVINGISLHNCRVPFDVCGVCKNKAPTRSHYCEHAKYYLSKIWPETGQLVYVVNFRPRFHDISQVFIGADRIAKTLKKVASQTRFYMGSALEAEKYAEVNGLLLPKELQKKSAERKVATLEKEVPISDPPASEEDINHLAKTLMEIKAREEPIPREVLDSLAEKPLPKVMSTLAVLGILPKPQEFQRIVLISCGNRRLADELDEENMCFDPSEDIEPDDRHYQMLRMNPAEFSPSIFNVLRRFMGERSCYQPHLARRMTVLVKRAAQEGPYYVKTDNRKSIGIAPMLLATAGLYAAFGKKAPEVASGIDKMVLKHPMLAAALGISLVTTFKSMFGEGLKGTAYRGPDPQDPDVLNVSSRIERLRAQPLEKMSGISRVGTASGLPKMSPVKALIVGAPLAYMTSGALQRRREVRPYENEGMVSRFVRNYPDVITAALAANALFNRKRKTNVLGMGKFGQLGYFDKAKDWISQHLSKEHADLIKEATSEDYLLSSLVIPAAMGKANLPARVVGGMFDQAILDMGSKLLKRKPTSSKTADHIAKKAGFYVNPWDIVRIKES